MRVIRDARVVPLYRTVEDEHGEILEVVKTGEHVVNTIDIIADKGKVLVDRRTNRVIGTSISLGNDESPSDYYEIDNEGEEE